MATRTRARTARRAPHPAVTELAPLNLDNADDIALPDVRLNGEPAPLLSRDARIELLAYSRAEARGFEPGYALDDWLQAEREVDAAEAAS